MKKKKILLFIPLIVIILIIFLSLTLTKPKNWIDNILKNDYEIYTLECDGTTNILDKKVLVDIKNKWKDLSNNGPFLGNINTCHKKIIIDYTNIVADIEIVDDTSIIVKENNSDDYYTYYTNAKELINYINKYFK